MDHQFFLASRSPRRRQLLEQVGLRFSVIAGDVTEARAAGQAPADYAVALARAKAAAGQRAAPAALPVLGADTDVVLDGVILGKPAGADEAVEMLQRLSDRDHEVYTGVAVQLGTRVATALSVTRVHFGLVSREAARAYWATGEPADKAGAYGIQGHGARFVRRIEGSYSGVVGLPLYETCELLARFDVRPSPAA